MTHQIDKPSQGIAKLTTPEEMVKVLRQTYPDNPLQDVPRRLNDAVKNRAHEDIHFWEQVQALLS